MQGPVATWIRRSFPEHPQLWKKLSEVVRFHPGPLLDSSFCYVLFSFVCFVFGFFCFGIFRLFCLVCVFVFVLLWCVCFVFGFQLFQLLCFDWFVLGRFVFFVWLCWGGLVCVFCFVVLFVSFVLPWLLCLGLVPFVLVVLPGLSPPP